MSFREFCFANLKYLRFKNLFVPFFLFLMILFAARSNSAFLVLRLYYNIFLFYYNILVLYVIDYIIKYDG